LPYTGTHTQTVARQSAVTTPRFFFLPFLFLLYFIVINTSRSESGAIRAAASAIRLQSLDTTSLYTEYQWLGWGGVESTTSLSVSHVPVNLLHPLRPLSILKLVTSSGVARQRRSKKGGSPIMPRALKVAETTRDNRANQRGKKNSIQRETQSVS
jgi:hypothetical protein